MERRSTQINGNIKAELTQSRNQIELNPITAPVELQ